MPICCQCNREGSRGFTDDGDGPRCTNTDQCEKRVAKAERAKLADRCVDCLESGEDPKGQRKLALKDDGTRQPGPRCVTHHRARRKDVSSQAHAKRIEANFELSAELYWALYQAQGCKCFVCRKSTGKARRLAVDHDHLLALEHGHDPKLGCLLCIRALLCKRCNTLVGWLDVEALQRAIILLTDPPARAILCPPDDLGTDGTGGIATPVAVALPGEPTAIPPELDGVVVDDELTAELAEAIDNATGDDQWIEDLADEDGIPQDDVTITEFFGVEPLTSDNFWFDPALEF